MNKLIKLIPLFRGRSEYSYYYEPDMCLYVYANDEEDARYVGEIVADYVGADTDATGSRDAGGNLLLGDYIVSEPEETEDGDYVVGITTR